MSEKVRFLEMTTSWNSKVALSTDCKTAEGERLNGVLFTSPEGVETRIGLTDEALDVLCALWRGSKPKQWHYSVHVPVPKDTTHDE